jgi:hypothetical protein
VKQPWPDRLTNRPYRRRIQCEDRLTPYPDTRASVDKVEVTAVTSTFPLTDLTGKQRLSAFRDRGVPGPTSEMSPRALAQMGRREAEREGGRKVAGDRRERGGNPASFVFVPRPGRVRLQ